MSLTNTSIAFVVVVIILVVYVNRMDWDADNRWERQHARLRRKGVVAQRPEDWEHQVQAQRARWIYITLGFVVLITAWFIWSIPR